MARATRIVQVSGLSRVRRPRPQLRPLALARMQERPPPSVRQESQADARGYLAGDYLALRLVVPLFAGAVLGAAAAVTLALAIASSAPPGADRALSSAFFLAALITAVGAMAARAVGRRRSLRFAPAWAVLAFGAVFALAAESLALPRSGAADAVRFVATAAALLSVLGVLRACWSAPPSGPDSPGSSSRGYWPGGCGGCRAPA